MTNILSQSSNATREGQEFLRPIAEGQFMMGKLKNLYRTENTLSGAWFFELLSDRSKTLFGS